VGEWRWEHPHLSFGRGLSRPSEALKAAITYIPTTEEACRVDDVDACPRWGDHEPSSGCIGKITLSAEYSLFSIPREESDPAAVAGPHVTVLIKMIPLRLIDPLIDEIGSDPLSLVDERDILDQWPVSWNEERGEVFWGEDLVMSVGSADHPDPSTVSRNIDDRVIVKSHPGPPSIISTSRDSVGSASICDGSDEGLKR